VASYFFDSSALAKRYHPEVGTQAVDEIVNTAGNEIRISRLTVVELPSVFAIKVRTQFINREDAHALLRQFSEDILTKKLAVFAIREPEFALAERLVEQYAFDLRLRALDALQLAVALGLRHQGRIHFVAADKVLCEVAAMEGHLQVSPKQDLGRKLEAVLSENERLHEEIRQLKAPLAPQSATPPAVASLRQ
jgi:predicted nucleic acid-binding protein